MHDQAAAYTYSGSLDDYQGVTALLTSGSHTCVTTMSTSQQARRTRRR